MTDTHTPGPWTAKPDLVEGFFRIEGCDPVFSDGGGAVFADVYPWRAGAIDGAGEAAANARLIAAAPDLLAALQPLAAMGDASVRKAILATLRPHERDSFIAATDNARDAIAKATGGQS